MNPNLESAAARVLLNAGWSLDAVLAVLRPSVELTVGFIDADVDFEFDFTTPNFAEFALGS